MEWLNFPSSEIHKQFGTLFNPKITAEWKANQLDLFGRRFDYLTERLNGKSYLMGDQFTVVDTYLFTVLNSSALLKVDLGMAETQGVHRARGGSPSGAGGNECRSAAQAATASSRAARSAFLKRCCRRRNRPL